MEFIRDLDILQTKKRFYQDNATLYVEDSLFEEEKKNEKNEKLKFKKINLRIEMPKFEYKLDENG